MKRSAPLKRRRRTVPKAERTARRRFYDQVLERDDYACLRRHEGGCSGPLDAHHIIAAQTLRAHTSTLPAERRIEATFDPRNGITVCRAHHHRLTVRADRLTRGEVPPDACDFAREWALGHALEREIER